MLPPYVGNQLLQEDFAFQQKQIAIFVVQIPDHFQVRINFLKKQNKHNENMDMEFTRI